MREILFRAKKAGSGEWVDGYFAKGIWYLDGKELCAILPLDLCIYPNCEINEWIEVDPETVCQYTGLTDKNGRKIFKGDILKLILPSGEIRYFKVSIKRVVRKVLCHPDFDDKVSRVEITGVVFEWNGYELFPCVDTYGVPDYKMMEVVGNIFDNPELLEVQANE